jgi:hypothetical protein
MIQANSPAEACRELFARYPVAIIAADRGSTSRTMVLMLRDGDDLRLFILSHEQGKDRPPYSIRLWRTTESVDIAGDDGAAVSDTVMTVLTRGIPVPRDRSLFGWRQDDHVTALIPVYTTFAPRYPEPFWAVMPRVGIPEAQWPPFTDEHLFGLWFWEYYRSGDLVSVDGLIAEAPGTVFWIDTSAILGSDSCAVARDIKSPEGFTLERGRYVYHQALRAGKPTPSLRVLLADTGKTDLAPRFRRTADYNGWEDPGSGSPRTVRHNVAGHVRS